MKTFEDLIDIIARLRAPEGCPWDREQTYATLGPMLIEEAYEVIDSAEAANWDELRDELGDLLFQIVFYGQIAREQGHFDLQQSITRVYDKMIRRHPHVFGQEKVENTAHVLANWEAIKAAERKADESDQSLLDGTSTKLPGLLEAYLLTTKAARVGFDWKQGQDIFQKLEEETRELQEELNREDPDQEAITGEIGDLLFVVANIARWYGIEPESALKRTNRKFRHRFKHIEKRVQEDGRPWKEISLEELNQFWDEAKRDYETDENNETNEKS
ncbi:MAG: nucleoside triphosphate pyrophosphohydrolase [Acidobacteria bacterium]|nr:nucleoside triphosphate pyrophosphohydrolase [Acidobacteriota bacterium]